MRRALIAVIGVVYAGESLWIRESKVDRANLLVVGDVKTEGYWLWQNSLECHHCSWVRVWI